jgi:hypothetical protein
LLSVLQTREKEGRTRPTSLDAVPSVSFEHPLSLIYEAPTNPMLLTSGFCYGFQKHWIPFLTGYEGT